jgi:excisionase family DNA binding protein
MSRRLETILSAYSTHLSVSDLAAVLGVTMKTTYEYLQAGDIPAYRVVRKWVILRDDVRDFLERSSVYRPGPGETAAAGQQQPGQLHQPGQLQLSSQQLANQQAQRGLTAEQSRALLNRPNIRR